MSKFVSMRLFFSEKKMLVLNCVAVGFLILGSIVRFATTPEGKRGFEGTPAGQYVMMFLWNLWFCALIIMGEVKKPESILVKWPLLVSRTGKGWILIWLSFFFFSRHWFPVLCCVIGIIIGGINIFVGFPDPPM